MDIFLMDDIYRDSKLFISADLIIVSYRIYLININKLEPIYDIYNWYDSSFSH